MSDKLAPKSNKYLFVGYPRETKGYYFYNRSENKVFVARNGYFLEREFISKETSGRRIQLKEVWEPQTNTEPTMDIQSDSQLIVESELLAKGPRRYGSTRH